MITQSKRPRIDLLIQPKNALLASSMVHGAERIKKEISVLNKDFTKDGVPSGKFRNRPVLSMTRKDLDFSSRNLVSNTYTSREHLLNSNKKRKNTLSINSFIKTNKQGIVFNQKENNEFNCFMKEMTTLKKKMLYARTQIEIK